VIAVEAERFEIARPLDLQLAVLRSQRSALLRGASDLERSVVATIVSELASNMLKYAERGTLELERLRAGDGPGVQITARDAGPGIADVALALTDHYSSGRTHGLGLPGVRRMADELEIIPTPGGGTTVHVRKRWLGPTSVEGDRDLPEPPLTGSGAAWSAGAALRPRLGQRLGGDHVAIVDRGDRVLIGIVDASGHGPAAHALARGLVRQLRERFVATTAPDDVAALAHALHEACVGTIGAAVGLAVLDPERDAFRYLAVGNVRAAVVGAKRFVGVSRDGVLGRRWPTPFVQSAPLRPGDLLLLWTDGLPSTLVGSVAAAARPGAVGSAAPAALAERLVAAHAKPLDDAACLVARWRP
jgi:anti-sigma regulatory factor (Ser/Thr protein kinase)